MNIPFLPRLVSLRTYLSLALAALILLSAALLAGIEDELVNSQVTELANQNLENIGLQIAREISSGISEFGREVETQALSNRLQSATTPPEEMRSLLERFVDLHPEFVFLGVVDVRTSKVIAANGGIFEGGSAKGRPAFEQAKDKLFLGDVHDAVRLAELLPKPMTGETLRFLDASAPIRDASGQVHRVLTGHISFEWTRQVLNTVLGPTGEKNHFDAFIVDTAGKIVLSTNPGIQTGTPLANLVKSSQTRTGVQEWTGGIPFLTSFAPVVPRGSDAGFGWKIVTRQPLEVALGPAHTIQRGIFIGALTVGSVAALLAWLLAGRVAKPVQLLADSVKDLHTAAEPVIMPSAIGEVSQVQQAFARLAVERQQQIRMSDERQLQFTTLAESLLHLVYLTDGGGNLIYVNSLWHKVFLPTLATNLDRFADLMEAAHRESFSTLLKKAQTTGTDIDFIARMLVRDGPMRWFRIRGRALSDEAGANIRGWVGTVTDIDSFVTAAARVEADLVSEREARVEAERVSRMKDEFLATLSHELRTPLSVIGGWAQLLELRCSGDAYVQQAVGVIRRNVDLQSGIINDLLDMSAVLAGKVTLELQLCDAVALTKNIVQSVEQMASTKGVVLTAEIENGAKVIAADPRRFSQILANLLGNAIKFTDAPGSITVQTDSDGQNFIVRVIDTGGGIAPDFLPHVFERFRQQDASSTRTRGGIGLGLSISKSLVDMHEGTIAAASEGVGKGSTFTVTIPLQPCEEIMQDDQKAAPQASLQGGTEINDLHLLLVEDDADVRDVAEQMLRTAGYTVTSAASARQAMTLLEQSTFDVLLCDISMPEMDGLTLVKTLRENRDGLNADIPAVALTAHALQHEQSATKVAGFQLHLAKPFTVKALVHAVNTLRRDVII